MIELTVKTLDSQNHQFTVEDDITVEQFKIKIADTVNIAADTQRIIYCGRVLQDNSKLADYDVNGKVVHLVQRPPPGTTPRSNSRSASPQPQRRGFRGFRGLEQGNAMYLGSMAFPGNLMESQGIVPPPPTHSLSGSRLNVARRMLRRAEAVIQMLENPTARSQDQPVAAEENQEDEEVTPVIEARVLVPNNNEPIDEVLNAVQNTLMNASNSTSAQANSRPASVPSSSEATPSGATPRSSSTENLTGESRSTTSGFPENASRTVEMSELLTMLGHLQARFAPFLERYQTFMTEDPEVTADNQRSTQTMLNRVSEVMHFLGHAYHSLSDLIIRVRTPPPRPLLCRPILIQHSAVVQTGIPIQVEAQINLSADRVAQPSTTTATSTEESSTSTTATTATSSTTTSTSTRPTISIQPGFVGLPFIPNTAMRVQSFPVEIRQVRPAANPPRTTQTESAGTTATTTTTTTTTTTGTTNTDGGANNQNQENPQFNFNNPNVEFFMEVTPEGITIDSLETTVVGSNQTNDLLRGALNGPPPEFLQSLMQMAGQIMNRNMTTGGAESTQQSFTNTTTSTTSASGTATATPQNVNATGGSRTSSSSSSAIPATATNTRSTSRPHVHLAQQAMQGGFDPFLPCNSHHISRRRLQPQTTSATFTTSTPNPTSPNSTATDENSTGTGSGDQRNRQNVVNLLSGVFDSIRSGSDGRSGPESSERSESRNPPAGASNSSTHGDHVVFGLQNVASLSALLSNLQGGLNLPDLLRQGPTLDQLLHQFQDDQYVPGESIIIDLIMLFIRNLTLIDIFTLYNGNVEPINRNVSEIQNFFRSRICDGDVSANGIDRGVERVVAEMQPFLQNFSSLQVRNDIDMVRSAEQLFRQRLPNIINIAVNLNTNTTRILIDQCLTTAKQLLALTLLASANAQRGVEQVYERIMTQFMRDVPQDIQNWTLMTSLVQLRQIVSNLSIPERLLQPYIVRRSDQSILRQNNEEPMVQNEPEEELMEVDAQEIRTEMPQPIIINDPEPLPNVVLGSEPWHGQVPEDWVPIITRDAQKQRRQNPQGPFSDAYLSGMPSKRRKIVTNAKPHGSLPQVIADSVRQAVSASGLTSVAPLEAVAQAAGGSTEIQNAYRNLLRSTVQSSLKDNEDFLPERYPNVSNYFNSGSQ